MYENYKYSDSTLEPFIVWWWHVLFSQQRNAARSSTQFYTLPSLQSLTMTCIPLISPSERSRAFTDSDVLIQGGAAVSAVMLQQRRYLDPKGQYDHSREWRQSSQLMERYTFYVWKLVGCKRTKVFFLAIGLLFISFWIMNNIRYLGAFFLSDLDRKK